MSAETGDASLLRERLSADDELLVVVAGPNGAGKTTFVQRYIKATGLRIVNPDEIARALAPEAPDTVAYEAAQLAETVRRDLVSRGVSFCMETVFSDRVGAKIEFLQEARSRGYFVFLVFVGLDSPQLAMSRVMQRAETGGHDVPDEKIVARFPWTIENLRAAIAFVDHALVFDNSSADEPYRFVAEFEGGRLVRQERRPAWSLGVFNAKPS